MHGPMALHQCLQGLPQGIGPGADAGEGVHLAGDHQQRHPGQVTHQDRLGEQVGQKSQLQQGRQQAHQPHQQGHQAGQGDGPGPIARRHHRPHQGRRHQGGGGFRAHR